MKLAHSRTTYAAKYKMAPAHFEACADRYGSNHSLCRTRTGIRLSGIGINSAVSYLKAVLGDDGHGKLFDSLYPSIIQFRDRGHPSGERSLDLGLLAPQEMTE